MTSKISKDFAQLRGSQKAAARLSKEVGQISVDLSAAVRGVLGRSDVPEMGDITGQYRAIKGALASNGATLDSVSGGLDRYVDNGIKVETLIAILLGKGKLPSSIKNDKAAMGAYEDALSGIGNMASNIDLAALSEAGPNHAETLARVRVLNRVLGAYGLAQNMADTIAVIDAIQKGKFNEDTAFQATHAGLGLTGAAAQSTVTWAALFKAAGMGGSRTALAASIAGKVNAAALSAQILITGYQVGDARLDTLVAQEEAGLDTVKLAQQDWDDRKWSKPVGGYNVVTAWTRREVGEHVYGKPEFVPRLTDEEMSIVTTGLRAAIPGTRVVANDADGTYTIHVPHPDGPMTYTISVETGRRA